MIVKRRGTKYERYGLALGTSDTVALRVGCLDDELQVGHIGGASTPASRVLPVSSQKTDSRQYSQTPPIHHLLSPVVEFSAKKGAFGDILHKNSVKWWYVTTFLQNNQTAPVSALPPEQGTIGSKGINRHPSFRPNSGS